MSFKKDVINAIISDATVSLVLMDSSDEEEEDDIFNTLEGDLLTVHSFRYAVRNPPVPKSSQWLTEVLPNLDERRFKEMLRVSRQQFSNILMLVENHPIYTKVTPTPQTAVFNQVAISLYRLGCYGEGGTASKVSALFGIGDGGTIERILYRFFTVILSMESTYIQWPDSQERGMIVRDTMCELPNCIGYLDGCEIPLAEVPALDNTGYYSRKQRHCVKLQAVCDKNLKIRHTLIGFPGSVHDARVFAHSEIAKNPQKYFTGSQWVAADSAYKLTETVITPFRSNATFRTAKDRRMFNKHFSDYRVRVEQCFGILKKKFASLKELRIRIKDKRSHTAVCNWIRVCCILYNVVLPFSDEEDMMLPDFNETNDNDNTCQDECEGNLKREHLFCMLFG